MFKKFLMNMLLQQLLDRSNRDRITNVVTTVANYEISGEEKRAVVVQEVTDISRSVGTHIVNLAIELAVAKLRE